MTPASRLQDGAAPNPACARHRAHYCDEDEQILLLREVIACARRIAGVRK